MYGMCESTLQYAGGGSLSIWCRMMWFVPLTLPAEVDPATQTALLEPSGVVQLARTAFSGIERTG